MTTYKEVFQLAQDKGYDPMFERKIKHPEAYPTYSFLELTLIQKWLRDEHKMYVFAYKRELSKWLYVIDHRRGHNPFKYLDTYEQALLEGIAEALKML